MKAELIESVEEFLAATAAHRATDPLRTNVIGSVAHSVLTKRSAYERCRWWIVRDDEDAVVGEAMRTGPLHMVVSPMPGEAARHLGVAVGSLDDDLPGLGGPAHTIDYVLEGYRSTRSVGSRRTLSETRRDLLYELHELTVPHSTGSGRPSEPRDIDELAHGYVAFMHEAALPPPSLVEAREGVEKSVAAGSLFCWEYDGSIVSFAGHAPLVPTDGIVIARIGPVYTPPDHRNRGFGSAVTAAVSQHLLERGARVMLFTDSTNPTSNHIYQELGFHFVDEVRNVQFDAAH